MDVVRDSEEAARFDRPPLVVLERLEEVLDRIGIEAGMLSAEPIGEGHSNVTYLLRRGVDRVVLRRPPRPPYPPSAHNVVREARIVAALGRAGARVPEVLAIEEDPATLGAPFYLMAYVPGHVLTADVPAALADPDTIAAIGPAIVDALVDLHAIDPRGSGLDGFGRAEGYLDRQLRRFSDIWAQIATRSVPDVEMLHDWLVERPTPMVEVSAVTQGAGFSRRDDLLARYAARSGRDLTSIGWYETLALWKSCVFLEASYGRYLAGTTDDPFFANLRDGVPRLAAAAARRVASITDR